TGALAMHIVFDDHLHTDAHMDRDGYDQEEEDDGDEGRAEDGDNFRMRPTDRARQNGDKGDDQRQGGDRSHALTPEMISALTRRTEMQNTPQRRLDLRPGHHHTTSPTSQMRMVSTADAISNS